MICSIGTLVMMTVVGYIPHDNELREVWRFSHAESAKVCLEMSALANGGKAGAVIVTCKRQEDEQCQ